MAAGSDSHMRTSEAPQTARAESYDKKILESALFAF